MDKKSTALGLLMVFLTLAGVLFFFAPVPGGIYPPCPTRYFTNLSCPGCGSLRAVHNLLHGRFKEAFFFNPLLVLLLPFLSAGFILYFSKLFFKTKLPDITLKPVVFRLLFSAIIIFMALRNLPFYPFYLFRS